MTNTTIFKIARSLIVSGIALTAIACSSVDTQEIVKANPNQRLDTAMAHYESVKSLNDECFEMWHAGNALVDCQRIRAEIEKLYVEFPTHERIILANAIVNYDAGQKDDAQWMLDQLNLFQRTNPEAAMLRSEIALTDGNINFARELIDFQVMLAPGNPGLREMEASIAYLQNRFDDSRQALSIAGRLGAPAWRLSYHHGLLSESQNQLADACNFYKLSLDQKPDFQSALSRVIALIDQPDCSNLTPYIR